MRFSLKPKKSAGIPVSTTTYRLIREANGARDRQDWASAATAFRSALEIDPALRHIWVQLGHVLKEADRIGEATEAYEEAAALRSEDPEPLVHIAHMRKRAGDMRAATLYFLRAIRTGDVESLDELGRIIAPIQPIAPSWLYLAARHAELAETIPPQSNTIAAAAAIDRVLAKADAIELNDDAILRSTRALLKKMGESLPTRPTIGVPGIVFDVTDLMAHFRHHRLPTGIQRVQIEVVTRALRDPGLDVRICCFVDGREGLLDIPGPLFAELVAASTSGTDNKAADWGALLARVFIHLLLADPFGFHHGDRLVNLGTSWWVYNYFLLVRNAKRDFSITYIPFIHDFIPIMASDHCVTGVVEDYVSWLVGVFDHADFFLVNSQSTARDLIRAAERLGRNVDHIKLEVVPLNADFRQPLHRNLPTAALARWNLAETDYCLFVSTIESRKNHMLALDAWARLIEDNGADAVPVLVCVGRSGWLNGKVFEKLNRNARLREHVILIERVSDDELALLYQHCRFTIYPSHYEGWGLPVTESLCYGRVPVVADNSSLPEAGGEFAIFFQSNSLADFVARLERLLFEPGLRDALEQSILLRFKPRSWASIATQITDAVTSADRGRSPLQAQMAIPGQYYPVSLYKGERIWRRLGSGEYFRVGTGWLWPETIGCRTTASGGELRIPMARAALSLRLYLKLRGLESKTAAFLVSNAQRTIACGSLNASEERWVLGDITRPTADEPISVLIRGGSTEEIELTNGGTSKRMDASIAVVGFALVEQADEASRVRFVEDAALAGLDRINAYADRRQNGGATSLV